MALGVVDQRLGEAAEPCPLPLAPRANPQQRVRRNLIVAAPGGVQAAARIACDLRESPLDRGVDVLVAGCERERPRCELLLDLVEACRIAAASSPETMAQAPSIRAWAREQAMSSAHMRRSTGREALSRSKASAGSRRIDLPTSGSRSCHPNPLACDGPLELPHTRATCSSVISGKNGSAIVEALMDSVTGRRPGRYP